MSSISINFAANDRISFLFITENFPQCVHTYHIHITMYITHTLHFHWYGSHWFHIFDVMESTITMLCAHDYFFGIWYHFLWNITRNWIAGSHGRSMSRFWGASMLFSLIIVLIHISSDWQSTRVAFSLPPLTAFVVHFLGKAVLILVIKHFIVVLFLFFFLYSCWSLAHFNLGWIVKILSFLYIVDINSLQRHSCQIFSPILQIISSLWLLFLCAEGFYLDVISFGFGRHI
jgi:hypothetical protein